MKRVIDVDAEFRTAKFETALNKFFARYPELDYWKELFEYMYEHNEDVESDNEMADGTYNDSWRWALRLDAEDHYYYFAIIERA